MIKLFTSGTTRALPPCMILEELGVQYEFANCDIGIVDKPRELINVNPAGRVPVLLDNDVIITQSTAILIYIAEKYNRLLPGKEPERSKTICQLLNIATDVISNHTTIFRVLRNADQFNAATLLKARQSLALELGRLNASLAESRYLAEELSIADFQLYTIVGQYDRRGLEERGFQAMIGWIDRMRALNGVRIAEGKISYAYDVSTTLG
ncbi:glutathione S-transferase family protein [Bradyrhizobium sp. U531]|uniref:glutathione S-transferase family protein n=1 Tax=Bradyrhizobium sp. U531 TaxID=3053458 RepID=UPI003F443C33